MKDLIGFLEKYNITDYIIEGDRVVYNDDLYLCDNQLTELPQNFGNLKVNGDLALHNNQLRELPE